MKPLIGITGRRLYAGVIGDMDARFGGRYADFFFADYARCVAQAGGVPVELPFEAAGGGAFARLQGLIVTGGQDVSPDRWGGTSPVATGDPRAHYDQHDGERDDYEFALIREAVAAEVPVLGVCRGIQTINAALGGTLIEDLPTSSVGHVLAHEAPHDGQPDHAVTFDAGTLAHAVFGERRQVNSWHHQAVDRCAESLRVSGRADDGVVETVELPNRRLLGVQWHPEWHVPDGVMVDPAFAWLVDAAAGAAARTA